MPTITLTSTSVTTNSVTVLTTVFLSATAATTEVDVLTVTPWPTPTHDCGAVVPGYVEKYCDTAADSGCWYGSPTALLPAAAAAIWFDSHGVVSEAEVLATCADLCDCMTVLQ